MIIWNQGLSGLKNFLQISNFEGKSKFLGQISKSLLIFSPSVTNCLVDKVQDDSILDWLFGFDPNCVEADDNHCTPPNIGSILHALPNLTWVACEDYKGMDV